MMIVVIVNMSYVYPWDWRRRTADPTALQRVVDIWSASNPHGSNFKWQVKGQTTSAQREHV